MSDKISYIFWKELQPKNFLYFEMNADLTCYHNSPHLKNVSTFSNYKPKNTKTKKKQKRFSKKFLPVQDRCWPSVKFLIPSYKLGWLLIKCRLKTILITWDDCWFSLPGELSKLKCKIKKMYSTFYQNKFLYLVHSLCLTPRENQSL